MRTKLARFGRDGRGDFTGRHSARGGELNASLNRPAPDVTLLKPMQAARIKISEAVPRDLEADLLTLVESRAREVLDFLGFPI